MTAEDDRTKRIHVMLVEDHPDFRNLMTTLLGRQSDIELVALAGSLRPLGHDITLEFGVVVLDLGCPDGVGSSLIAVVRQAKPSRPTPWSTWARKNPSFGGYDKLQKM